MLPKKRTCECLVNLPHTSNEISQRLMRKMPSCICTPDPRYETEGVAAMETRNYVKSLGDAVDIACHETSNLRKRIDVLEDQFEEAERTGVVLHADDCVYSNKFTGSLEPRPPSPPDTDAKMIRCLEKKLDFSNRQLVFLRNANAKLRGLLTQCKSLLAKELGIGCQSLGSLGEMMRSSNALGWKSRTQTIRILKGRIVDLESKLRESQSMFRHDVERDAYNPEFQVNTDFSVSRHQRQVLNTICARKLEVIHDKDQVIGDYQRMYEEMEILYKAAKSRNKTLIQELDNQRDKVKTLTGKADSDEELISTLMKHQNLMREMLDQYSTARTREAQREQDTMELMTGTKFIPKIDDPKLDVSQNQMECEKFKTLYVISENKSQSLENMVIELQNRLDLVSLQVVEAEKHCADHQCRLLALKKQFEHLKRTGNILPRGKLPIQATTKESSAREQLDTLRQENNMLRSFIKDTVLNKAEDFELYKASLKVAKRSYLLSLQKLREAKDKPQPDETEEEE